MAYDAMKDAGIPVVLVVNQVDQLSRQDRAAAVSYRRPAKPRIRQRDPVSASAQGSGSAGEAVLTTSAEQPALTPEDEITDKSHVSSLASWGANS